MTTPKLPIPSLEETLNRYLTWVKPLLTPEQWQHTAQKVHSFLHQEGIALQQQLQQFAQSLTHGNWLIDTWLSLYLAERKPLPLASNVGFMLNRQQQPLHTWLYALAKTHADYQHQRIETPFSFHQTPMCRQQWQILTGAIRQPQHQQDHYQFSQHNRHIGIFKHGYYFRIPILNEQYEAYDLSYFKQLTEQLNAFNSSNPYPITVPCYLGSHQATDILKQLAQHPDNQQLLTHLSQDLFHLSWNETASHELAHNLQAATFLPKQNVWCYKPITLWYNHTDQTLILHCEHTWQDGGTIAGIIEYAQNHLTDLPQSQPTPHIQLAPQQWQLTPALQQQWHTWQTEYQQQANHYQLHILELNKLANPPKGISLDALMQFTLQYAQLHAFQKIRNTYEAVDVSHFQHGRTECVRPISNESVQFIQALYQQQATWAQFQAALNEHKTRIKACKQGHGINRHLLGLKSLCQNTLPELFNDITYQIISTDFLSTSTMGSNKQIECFAFAPTSEHGFGINYTITPAGWRYVVSYQTNDQPAAEKLIEGIQIGATQITEWLQTHQPTE